MGSKYRHWSCQMMNAMDPTAGCECGRDCDQPVPSDDEMRALQTDLPAFERWFDAKDVEAREGTRRSIRRAVEDAVADTRMMIYRELQDSLTDEQVRAVLNGDRPFEEMTEDRAWEWYSQGRLMLGRDKPDNPLNEDEFMALVNWGRSRLGLGADAFEHASREWGKYRCPVCARFDDPSCATEC